MKKRIMSMLLVLTMVCSLIIVPGAVATAVSYYDTVDTDCELAVDVLSALGIMGGYTDGSFLPYNSITRAEMVAIAVKLAGIDAPEEAPDDMDLFADMYDYDGWASGVVAIAKSAGIAKSDDEGNFNPDMSASYEDAMQMIVSALGYGHQAMSRGDSLLDYVYVAQRLGITKKLNAAIGQNITRADVAKLVYNALTVDLMEPVTYSVDGTAVTYTAVAGKNALNTYFEVGEVSGIITENEYAAIDGDTTVEEEQVLINGEAFDVGSTDIADYLGYYATVYVLDSEDDTTNRTVIAYSIKNVKNNTLTIKSENLVGVERAAKGYVYSYWVDKENDKKAKEAETSATPYVLYNGKAAKNVTTAMLTPENGHIVLIDNNGDDKYDIIDIWKYELVFVFSASSTSGNVSDYYNRSKTYKLSADSDSYNVKYLNAYGGMAQLSDIKQYSVLYVYESEDETEKKVIIANNKINGTVTEVGSDGVYVIGGTEYEISPAAEGRVDLAVSDAGDFYLDADNRIVGFEGTTVIRRNIGMFIAIENGGLREGYQVKILTANNGVQIYRLADVVDVNGEKMEAKEIEEMAFSDVLFGKTIDPNYLASGMDRPHPSRAAFLYKFNTKGEINAITVVGEDGYLQVREIGKDAQNRLYYSKDYNCLHFSEEKTKDEYGVEVGVRTYCDNSTINFIVEEALSHTDDNQSFKTQYMTSYWNNYNFEKYDYVWAYYYSPDEEPVNMQKTVCNFLVMADWYDMSVDSTEDAEQNTDATHYQDNTPPKFIYKITEANDRSADETTYRVYYFDGTNLRNALIRPKYAECAFMDDEDETDDIPPMLYPNGFPVRISFHGSYIEDIAPYFDNGIYTKVTDMVKPIHNEKTDTYVMPFMPFAQEQHRKWNASAYYAYYTRMYCGVITSVDKVVNTKLFNLAYAEDEIKGINGEPNYYTLSMLANERLEGNVYRINYDRDGYFASITRGSIDDIAPGQLVIVRKRGYDSSPNWLALTGYAIHEFFIISDNAEELDYLHDFYEQVQDEYVNED